MKLKTRTDSFQKQVTLERHAGHVSIYSSGLVRVGQAECMVVLGSMCLFIAVVW